MTQMNLPMNQKKTHRYGEQTCDCLGWWGEGWIGILGIAEANYCLMNK